MSNFFINAKSQVDNTDFVYGSIIEEQFDENYHVQLCIKRKTVLIPAVMIWCTVPYASSRNLWDHVYSIQQTVPLSYLQQLENEISRNRIMLDLS